MLAALLAFVSLSGAAFGALLFVAYGLGHCVLALVGGTSIGFARRLADSRGWTRSTDWLRRIAGVLIVLVGVFLLFS